MKRHRMRTGALATGLVAVLTAGAAFASPVSANPEWYFNGELLTGAETVVNRHRSADTFLIPGLPVSCEPFPLEMSIFNTAGTGKGEVDGLTVGGCVAEPPCLVESFEAEGLPWPAHLVEAGGERYLVIEGIHIGIVFGGEECALNEVLVEIEGSAGGLIDNLAGTITFSGSSFKATGTELRAFGNSVGWDGTLAMQATGSHSGQALTAE